MNITKKENSVNLQSKKENEFTNQKTVKNNFNKRIPSDMFKTFSKFLYCNSEWYLKIKFQKGI